MDSTRALGIGILIGLISSLPACTKAGFWTNPLGDYEELQVAKQHYKIPVILVPGIKGSILRDYKRKRNLWGDSINNVFFNTFDDLSLFADLRRRLSKRDRRFDEDAFHEMIRPIVTDRHEENILESFRVGGTSFKLFKSAVYENLRKMLEGHGGYSVGNDLFLFYYDWRLDNRIAATKLALLLPQYVSKYLRFIEAREGVSCLPLWEGKVRGVEHGKSGGEDQRRCDEVWTRLRERGVVTQTNQVKVNIIAHSMGGLVAQYLIRAMGYGDVVHRLILLGTPNRGSVDALKGLAQGEYPESLILQLRIPLLTYPEERTRGVLFSFPSVFQLLPRYAGAIRNPQGESLTSPFGLGENTDEGAASRWERFNLIPVAQVHELAGAGEQELPDLERVLKEYVAWNLGAARCFHIAISGSSDCGEEEERRQAKAAQFLQDTQPEEFGTLAYHGRKPSGGPPPPVVVFGGHCHETLFAAEVADDPTVPIRFLRSGDRGRYQYGDGRVPFVSGRPLGLAPKDSWEFFLCEDHLNLVNNENFQYNLLKELLLVK